jgi:hypothetical protein
VEAPDVAKRVSTALNTASAEVPTPGMQPIQVAPVNPAIFASQQASQQAPQPMFAPQQAPQPMQQMFGPQQAPQQAPQVSQAMQTMFAPQASQPMQYPTQQFQPPMMVNPTASNVSAPPQSGFMWGSFGIEVQRYPINRFKASVGPTYRLSVIDRNIGVVRTHWLDDFGYFYCFQGKCCEQIGIPSVRYIVPIVLYDTDMTGQIISPKFDVMYLSVADDEYKALKSLDANIPIDQLDFIVTCSDQKFQALHMQNVGPATWRQYPQLGEQVMQKWNGNPQAGIPALRALLPTVIARVLNEASFMKVISGQSDASQPIPSQGTNLKSFLR